MEGAAEALLVAAKKLRVGPPCCAWEGNTHSIPCSCCSPASRFFVVLYTLEKSLADATNAMRYIMCPGKKSGKQVVLKMRKE